MLVDRNSAKRKSRQGTAFGQLVEERIVEAIERRFRSVVRVSAWYHEFRELVLTVAVYNPEQAIRQ